VSVRCDLLALQRDLHVLPLQVLQGGIVRMLQLMGARNLRTLRLNVANAEDTNFANAKRESSGRQIADRCGWLTAD